MLSGQLWKKRPCGIHMFSLWKIFLLSVSVYYASKDKLFHTMQLATNTMYVRKVTYRCLVVGGVTGT